MLYFAYGSNLDDAQMRARCEHASVVARATLPDHALAFGGFSQRWGGAVASVVGARGHHVPGLLYRLRAADLELLDRFEGHPYVYTRITRLVVDEEGRRRRALLYQQPLQAFKRWAPPPGYLGVLQHAYRRLGFSPTSLEDAAGRSR